MNSLKILLSNLAILTSLACTVLLARSYLQRRLRLLLWSALCFAALTVNNVLLFLDLKIFPEMDLRVPRLLAALVGMVFLLYAFVWDAAE